jgi:hypothetical protein
VKLKIILQENGVPKLTYKKSPYRDKFHPYVDIIIRLGGKAVGVITHKDDCWRIMLAVEKDRPNFEDGNPNCSWRNIFLAKKFSNSDEAKEWLSGVLNGIEKEYTLHCSD